MPKKGQECLEIAEYLDTLEDTTLSTKKSRTQCFISLKTKFDKNDTVTSEEVNRILTVFMNCTKKDISCLPHAIAAISSLLTNVKIIPNICVQDLLPSALALLHTLKTLCVSSGTETLREMSFELFLTYPVDVLNTMVVYNCSEILEIFDVYAQNDVTGINVNRELCMFLHKLLKMLSPEQKLQFVNEGTAIWFRAFLPTVIAVVTQNDIGHLHLQYVECLETLTETLVNVDYFQTPQWFDSLKCISNSQKYPLIMNNLLQSGSKFWHRLWIVFVKILKNQITSNCDNYGTPISSMLPIVETAFKMDVTTRCRAFQCWDSLIDNFSKETNLLCLPKRLKLLIIPLKMNNAKTAETALAKLNTWWNLIRKFEHKLDTFTVEVLVFFIQFAFGRAASERRPTIVGAGQLFSSVTEFSLQAFAQLIGHLDPNCCTALPKLKKKMLNNNLLASNWGDLMHALKTSIMMHFNAVKNGSIKAAEIDSSPISCLWKAFFVAIAELPPNNVRWDMFNGMLQVLIDMTESCHMSEGLSYILFTLTLSLLKDDMKIQDALTATTKGEEPLLHKIIPIILNPTMSDVYQSCDPEKIVAMLKPLTSLLIETKSARWLLNNLPHADSSVKLWTALLLSVKEFDVLLSSELMRKLLEWPIKTISSVSMDKYSSLEWCKAYNLSFEIMKKGSLDDEILKCILMNEENKDKRYFILYLTICLLKIKLIDGRGEDAGSLPKILQNLTSQMSDYKEFEQAVPILVDTIVVLVNNVTTHENKQLAGVALNCVKNILNMFFSDILSQEQEAVNPMNENICMMITNLFNAVELLLELPSYSDANCDFIDELREHALLMSNDYSKFIVTKMKTLNCSVVTVKNKILESIEMIEGTKKIDSGNTNNNVKEFTSPAIKKVVKRTKKKEASIVNTVVENGEEYVVVKSNWKFNPRKLTENQKEKFQRKRDIPALYQDLSQSQDEFRLTCWKTNSLDATTSNSQSENSTTNDKALCILKNITSSDVVPNIMENILSKNNKDHPCESIATNGKESECDLVTKKAEPLTLSTPKNTKSPRMALKDRVFRNVRNLIEKAKPTNDTKELLSDCQPENGPTTPKTNPKNNLSLIYSAPPLTSTDRPARMKKTPKKFDDAELFALRKRPRLQTTSNQDVNNDREIITANENNKDNMDGEAITDQIDSNNSTDQEIVIQNNHAEIKKKVESVQDVSDLETTSVTEHETTKETLNEPVTEGICETQNNDDAQGIQKNVDTQDDQNHETKTNTLKEVDDNDTVENSEIENNGNKTVILKTPVQEPKEATQKSTTKKRSTKKSRIEKELAIDMVEGHPFLKVQSEERLTRKKLLETKGINKRKSETLKIREKTETKIYPKAVKRSTEKDKLTSNSTRSSFVAVEETQEKNCSSEDGSVNDDAPFSEDVIESSQDSTLTTISVKSTKRTHKLLPVVAVKRIDSNSKFKITKTQDLLQDSCCEIVCATNKSANQESKMDIELPQNKTAEVEKNQSELTENMDTEPAEDENISDDVIIVENDESQTIVSSENCVGPETQELAEADTQPNNSADFMAFVSTNTSPQKHKVLNVQVKVESFVPMDSANNIAKIAPNGAPETEDVIEMDSEPSEPIPTRTEKHTHTDNDVCSPFKNDTQRKQDFLNNTSEISPIKARSPDRETFPPELSEETSHDYLVVTLSPPVQSNGEPFDKSPEFFTEDKTSPDKRDQSPPRAEVTTSSSSPSSSLSLKKNRSQALRPAGRAAHMLGLCVPDSMNTMKNSDRIETDEPKKRNTSTPVRRNLRVLYSAAGDASDNSGETSGISEEHDNFLKFKKALPSTDSSPSVPILKRKHIDIVDDINSPASKRKRVSFHDPPVSTTVSVQKYIEPGIKSPSSALKRLERQTLRSYSKSPKRLENAVVILDTVLSKAVESFAEEQANSLTNDTNASLDVTPAVEIVNTSELNDTDPICPLLVDCVDSIGNIASELSSPAMKDLLIKELEGKVRTVGDLAKMTELEVNRLCIKAPKVQIAKKVLEDYIIKTVVYTDVEIPKTLVDDTALATEMSEEMSVPEPSTASVETQTNQLSVSDRAMQTRFVVVNTVSSQTDVLSTAHTSIQTDETGSKSTSEVISSCLSERNDFVDSLSRQLEETSIRKISAKLSMDSIGDVLSKKCDDTSKLIISMIMNRESREVPNRERKSKEVLSAVRDFLCDSFNNSDLISICTQLLQSVNFDSEQVKD